jgi:hypothetical protein
MAKRKSDEGPEIVEQLRPDDSGWLAELRRAHTDPVDLASPAADGPDWAVTTTLHGERPGVAGPAAPSPPPDHAMPAPAPAVQESPRPTPARPAPSPLRRTKPASPPPPTGRPEPYHVDVTPAPLGRTAHLRQRIGRTRSDAKPADRSRRWGIVLPLVALAMGAAIGLAWQRGGAGPQVPADDAEAEAHPSATAPAMVVVITNIRDEGDTIRLTWVDPTDGQALFIVSEMTGEEGRAIRNLPPGQTDTVISGLDPNAPQYCFRVLAVWGSERAYSATTCTPQRTTTT